MKNSVYTHGTYPMPKNNQIGLFYFLWLGEHGRGGPYDISKIVKEHPDAGYHPDADYWGGYGVYHHWGEPFYGYYYSDDEWVVRRHMKLLIQSGVDFLFFDTTNAGIYENNAKLVMRVLKEYADDGWRIPKVMFYTNTRSGETVEKLYRAIYGPGFCPETWYRIDRKPAVIAFREEMRPELLDFFTVKVPQWPNEPAKTGGWPWMDFDRPQRVFTDADGNPECINVSVAQHPQLRFGDSVLYGEGGNRSRQFHDGGEDPDPGAYRFCGNLKEQFERALEADCPTTLVTGWNEWIAGYWHGSPERPVMFVDCADFRHSRDIEMMRGGYFDNYYMTLCDYTAKLKGREPETVCRIGETAVFHGFADGAMHRNHPGYGTTYENRTGRHSIRQLRLENRPDSLVFTLVTGERIDPADTEGTFLRIYVNPDCPANMTPYGIEGKDKEGAACGYRYALNLAPDFASGTTGAKGPEGEIRVSLAWTERSLTLAVPKSFMNARTLFFKASDSREPVRSVEDFYDRGDALPLGRASLCAILG